MNARQRAESAAEHAAKARELLAAEVPTLAQAHALASIADSLVLLAADLVAARRGSLDSAMGWEAGPE
jgi:hypothetical protein